MRRLRYSINVTLDGCFDHQAMVGDEELHRHAAENLSRADALIFGRVIYEMMEAAWREPAQTLDLKLVRRRELQSGAVAMQYEPR